MRLSTVLSVIAIALALCSTMPSEQHSFALTIWSAMFLSLSWVIYWGENARRSR